MTDKIKVLFLAANPVNSGYHLRVDEEVRKIDEKIQSGPKRDSFDLIPLGAVRTGDLQKALLRHEPHIVHFSGHGNRTKGIILEDDFGNMKAVDKKALAGLFGILKRNISIVVLNACYSKYQLEAFNQIIDYTIGMNKEVGDEAAIVFAAHFYQGLAFGCPVKEAFDLARNQLQIEGIPEFKTPELLVKDGVDVSQPLQIGIAHRDDTPLAEDSPQKRREEERQSDDGDMIGSLKIKDLKVKQMNVVKGSGNTFIGKTVNKQKGKQR